MTTRTSHRLSLASFVDHLHPSVMVGVLRPDGSVLHANRAALEGMGTSLEQVAGAHLLDTPWLAQAAAAREAVRQALAAAQRGTPQRVEVADEGCQGRRVLELAFAPVTDGGGEVGFIVVSGCDVTQRSQAQDSLSYLSNHDLLTGLPNRQWFRTHVERLRERNRGFAGPLLLVDLDRFSRIGKLFCDADADRVLQILALRMTQGLHEGERLVRLEGDQFGVLLAGGETARARACALAAELVQRIAQPLQVDGRELVITASVGVACAPLQADGVDRMLRAAAVALERAKASGRNRWTLYERERDEFDPQRLQIETALRRAVERGELDLRFQPQIDLTHGNIVGVEALLRWEHPELGPVSPVRFIPIAEEAGLIGPIGDWVLRKACETAARWQLQGLPPVRVSVNVSPVQLLGGELADRVEAVLAETGLEPRRLGIEITESLLMQHMPTTVRQLERLRALGVKISLDDFGTGYSSLSYLRRLPLDAIKIDRSLLPQRARDADALPIIRAIIAMSHSLGLKVVAEGVETEAQVEMLVASECDEFQGYHFSRPESAVAVGAMLRSGRRLPVLERRRAARVRSVVLVDDDAASREALRRQLLRRDGELLQLHAFGDAQEALRCLGEQPVDLVVCALARAVPDGIGLLHAARSLQPQALRLFLLDAGDMAPLLQDERQVDVFRYIVRNGGATPLHTHLDAALEEIERLRALRHLCAPLAGPSPEALELLRLEAQEPGLTAVARGPHDELVLPSQMMTLPGDLWVAPATGAGRGQGSLGQPETSPSPL